MKISYFKSKYKMTTPLIEPPWSEKVSRWYQLDGPALAMCQLFFEHDLDFDYLILASPTGSNETDRDFVTSGAQRAQKFVHTLPNVRASMALQLRDKPCRFMCFVGGIKTLEKAQKEFYALSLENFTPALVSVRKVSSEEDNGEYEAWAAIANSPSNFGVTKK